MTTLPLFRALAFVLVLSGCASPPVASSDDVVGTWRWVSVDGQQVDQLFYIRYDAGGEAATWPAPKGWADSKGVSRGGYSIINGYLVLDTGLGVEDPKSRIRIQKDHMTLTTEEGHRLLYQRVPSAPEPGNKADGSPAGFANH